MASHASHAHPATPAARAACRKGLATFPPPLRRPQKAAQAAAAPILGRDEAAGVWRWSDGSTSPLETRFSAGENGVPK